VEFAELFPGITTRRDSRAVDRWELDGRRGYMLAAGVGGPITGHGALLGIIDDPVENWEAAQSETIRAKTWEWYRTTFRTRIWEDGAIVLIQTRWHEDDLAGRLLQDQPGEWSVLRLPALAETQGERDENNARLSLAPGAPDPMDRAPGAPLCPQRFSLQALEQLRRDVGSMAWTAQYQGCPYPPEGNRFKRHWLPLVEVAPKLGRRVRAWDCAATAGGGDYTAGVLMVKTGDGLFYVEDVVRGQWSPGERDRVILATAERDRDAHASTAIVVEQEPGSAGVDASRSIVRMLAGFPVRADRVTGSKQVRAEPFASQAEAGNVRLVRGAWNGAWLEELCVFPNGRHDDQVDASSAAFTALAAVPKTAAPRVVSGMSSLPTSPVPRLVY
jgi:predicted phage terminase large subunit-like protein